MTDADVDGKMQIEKCRKKRLKSIDNKANYKILFTINFT